MSKMKPKQFHLKEIQQEIKEPIDVFICCSSYESRCLSVATNLNKANIENVLVVENEDLSKYVGKNTQELMNLFAGKNRKVEIYTDKPVKTADNLKDALKTYLTKDAFLNILVDVTTFTHESLLILLKLLKLLKSEKSVIQLVYSSASDYCLGSDVGDKWLSKGVGEVRSVLGYPGKIIPSKKTHLMLLVGYEYERASKLIEVLEPNSIELGYGKAGSQTTEKNKEANKHFHKLVERVAASYGDVESFEFSCNDPLETSDEIIKRAKKIHNKNILLAPMNNKMSTIGAAMAAFSYDAIQVCYAPALHYNYENYSSPGENCYLMDIPELFE